MNFLIYEENLIYFFISVVALLIPADIELQCAFFVQATTVVIKNKQEELVTVNVIFHAYIYLLE
jgi:hypothetical protein